MTVTPDIDFQAPVILANLHGKDTLSKVTTELEKHLESFDRASRKIDRLQALATGLRHKICKNQQVWRDLKSDVVTRQHGIDPHAQSGFLSLAGWVEAHSQSVLSGGKELRPLVDVNRAIIEGLDAAEREACDQLA